MHNSLGITAIGLGLGLWLGLGLGSGLGLGYIGLEYRVYGLRARVRGRVWGLRFKV